ncbi:MAG: M12 family metallo-peptidase, partial [Flavobacteriaceae bacterium]|nr:M12 family metallo-peptidase [Flavobacteriaceae bacterium]
DLSNHLKGAPHKEADLKSSNFKIQFPDANGNMILFSVKESPVMHPDLAKKFPENKSYKGVGVNDSSLRIRFNINPFGLHAMIIDKQRKVQYIDPVSKNNTKYKVYARKDMNREDLEFQCFTENLKPINKSNTSLKAAVDKKLRTYRLALAGTGEYAQFHIDNAGLGGATEAQKRSLVLSEMTTLVTRINDVYENDLAISFQLVANNDLLIFLDPDNDPYTNDDGLALLTENQTTCDNLIGSVNYDIGHVLSTDGQVSRASLTSTCQSNSKARAATGSVNPSGDSFYFDFVAHEMGHQFGANHTFNGSSGNCVGSNRNDATAVEPGSGSTLMAYAGICSPQNVQSHSDLYFHVVSIDEILGKINDGNTGRCATIKNLTTNLFVPTANAGNDFILPKSTPYILKGEGSDGDNDPITFCWEQIDNEITTVPPSETATSGAIYRSKIPTANANRYMPELSTVVNGSLSSTWEATPSVARAMNFKLTVRDNNNEAGQIASDALTISVSNAAGPFLVTSQNTDDLVWDKNTSQNITWDVAGTSMNGINVTHVNILLSTDGGKTFATTLLANTLNDGAQDITVPDTSAPKCYIMVQAVDHFFYAINSKVFSIGQFNKVCKDYPSTDTPLDIPDNNVQGISSVINITDNFNVENIKVAVKIKHSWVSDLTLKLKSPSGKVIELLSRACFGPPNDDIDVVFDDNGSAVSCSTNPEPPVISGNVKPNQALSTLIGENSFGNWELHVADDAAVDDGEIISWSLELCTSEPALAVQYYAFDDFKLYPNPSHGIFNLEFTSNNTEDVHVSIFDLLGRKIITKTYYNGSTSFKEKLDISHVSKGLYILQIKRGNQSSAEKIQIH